ncbi:MAG: mechanosensitive ion channel domain-containing protein [Cyanobacteriota bacterium]|jgi:small-conductance mechanosensitive channel/CRP-like cAMP-binding protein
MAQSFAPAISAGQVGWVSVLIFGFPVAMVLLGEAIRRLQRRRQRFLAAVRILRNWIIPSLTLWVLLGRVMGLPRSTVLVRGSETLLWISLIYGALTLLNSVLFEDAPQGSWQAKVPQLFRDLGRFILVLVGSSIVLSTVWGADLGGFLTALGVGSLVLGLALQDSLGNIFSGVALLFEQPIRLGDWVEVNGKEGKVVEVNWRSVHLLTTDDDLVVVPNSELGKTSFTNMSRPVEAYIMAVPVNFSPNDPPNTVKEVLENTAKEIHGVLPEPEPSAKLVRFNEGSVSYVLEFACEDFGASGGVADALLRRLWYVARREGLTMPYPSQVAIPYQSPAANLPEAIQEGRLRGLRESCFAILPRFELERLASSSLMREYGAHEVVIQKDTPLSSLHVILAGEAELLAVTPSGSQIRLGILGVGECYGENVILLQNQIADTTIRASSDLQALVIDGKRLQALIDAYPRLGSDLSGVIDMRHRAMEALADMDLNGTHHVQEPV